MFKFNKIIEMVLKFFFPKDELDKKAENISIDILSKKLSLNNKTEDKFVYTLFDYRDEVIKNMIWSLKYKKNKKVAKLFAQILYDFLQEELLPELPPRFHLCIGRYVLHLGQAAKCL